MNGTATTRLVAFDLDGTLTQHKLPMSPEIRETLDALRARGHALLLVGAGSCARIARQMENYLIVKKYKPDIVVTRAHGAGSWSAFTGVPCLDPGLGINIIGYRGLYLFADALASSFRNTAVFDALKARYVSPFTDEFEALPPHSFYAKAGEEGVPHKPYKKSGEEVLSWERIADSPARSSRE